MGKGKEGDGKDDLRPTLFLGPEPPPRTKILATALNTWMATVRLAADKAKLDVSWTNYFTECKSKGRAYFKGKIQTRGGKAGGKAGTQGGSCPPCPPPRWRRP